jgi:hypothetical protein
MYVNDWGENNPLPNATVTEEDRSARVTWRGEDQTKFRVIVRQKPNPIGFHAKLPGDRRK